MTVNGDLLESEVEDHWHLGDVLRDQLGLTGLHLACEYGACGSCTVLLNGEPVRSCLTLAVQADGSTVTTVEGLATSSQLNPVQEAFQKHHGLQCGFCTPGFLVTGTYIMQHYTQLSRQEIRELLSGNLCRCTGYHQIVNAMEEAMAQRGDKRESQGG